MESELDYYFNSGSVESLKLKIRAGEERLSNIELGVIEFLLDYDYDFIVCPESNFSIDALPDHNISRPKVAKYLKLDRRRVKKIEEKFFRTIDPRCVVKKIKVGE